MNVWGPQIKRRKFLSGAALVAANTVTQPFATFFETPTPESQIDRVVRQLASAYEKPTFQSADTPQETAQRLKRIHERFGFTPINYLELVRQTAGAHTLDNRFHIAQKFWQKYLKRNLTWRADAPPTTQDINKTLGSTIGLSLIPQELYTLVARSYGNRRLESGIGNVAAVCANGVIGGCAYGGVNRVKTGAEYTLMFHEFAHVTEGGLFPRLEKQIQARYPRYLDRLTLKEYQQREKNNSLPKTGTDTASPYGLVDGESISTLLEALPLCNLYLFEGFKPSELKGAGSLRVRNFARVIIEIDRILKKAFLDKKPDFVGFVAATATGQSKAVEGIIDAAIRPYMNPQLACRNEIKMKDGLKINVDVIRNGSLAVEKPNEVTVKFKPSVTLTGKSISTTKTSISARPFASEIALKLPKNVAETHTIKATWLDGIEATVQLKLHPDGFAELYGGERLIKDRPVLEGHPVPPTLDRPF